MARSLRLLHHLVDRLDKTLIFGTENARKTVSIAGDSIFRSTITVADNYNVETLWTAGDGGLSTYTHGLILSNQDVLIECRNDNATPEFALLRVKANVPFYFGPVLAAGTAAELSDGNPSVDNTDFDSIDRIQVQRNVADAVGDATVTLALFA